MSRSARKNLAYFLLVCFLPTLMPQYAWGAWQRAPRQAVTIPYVGSTQAAQLTVDNSNVPRPDVEPPVVNADSVIYADDESVLSGAIPVTVTAIDNVGVASITMFLDGDAVAQVSSSDPTEAVSPVTWTLATNTEIENAVTLVGDGVHVLTVTARDAAGNEASLPPQTFYTSQYAPDLAPPVFTAVDMPDRSQLDPIGNPAQAINLSITATDNRGIATVAVIEDGIVTDSFAANGSRNVTFAATRTAAVLDGTHTFLLRATDTSGNVATFAIAETVPDTEAPVISIDSVSAAAGGDFLIDPAAGAQTPTTLAKGDMSLRVSATDNRSVAQLIVLLDGVAAPTSKVGISPAVTVRWPIAALPDGDHLITIKAIDPAGNLTTRTIAFASSNPVLNFAVSPRNLDANAANFEIAVNAELRNPQNWTLVFAGPQEITSISGTGSTIAQVLDGGTLVDGSYGVTLQLPDAPAGTDLPSRTFNVNLGSAPAVFSVSPDRVDPGAATTVALTGRLRAPGSWTIAFQGPTAIASLAGATQDVSETVDAQNLEDGIYTATLTVAGIADTVSADFVVDLVSNTPVAAIDAVGGTPVSIAESVVEIPVPTLVRDGLLTVSGTADDADPDDPVRWKFDLLTHDGRFVANVTPGPTDASGYRTGRVNSAAPSNRRPA